MGSLVSLQSACIGTRELAQCATKRFFPCMSPHVVLESRNSFARVVALCAIERFFFWMGLHVCLENRSFFARVVALFANEKLAAITLRLTDIVCFVDCLHFCAKHQGWGTTDCKGCQDVWGMSIKSKSNHVTNWNWSYIWGYEKLVKHINWNAGKTQSCS